MSLTDGLLENMSDDMETTINNEPVTVLKITSNNRRRDNKSGVVQKSERTSVKVMASACFNTLNHMIIGAVTVYISYFSFVKHDPTTHGVKHAYMTVFGVSYLFYKCNFFKLFFLMFYWNNSY